MKGGGEDGAAHEQPEGRDTLPGHSLSAIGVEPMQGRAIEA